MASRLVNFRIRPLSRLLCQTSRSVRTVSTKILPNVISGSCRRPSEVFHSQYLFTRYIYATTSLRSDVVIVSSPPFADSITEGDVRWEKAVGDQVAEDDVVAEIETDKTSIPVSSPVSGVIEELLVEDGATIEKGTPLFKVKVGGTGAQSKPTGKSPTPETRKEPAAPPPPAHSQSPPAAPSPLSPVGGPIPSRPPPVPPMPSGPMTSVPVSSLKATPFKAGQAPTTIVGTRQEHRVKMNRMRQRIAQRLKEAQDTCAMLTTFNEIDMSNVMELRSRHKEAFQKKHNIKLGFMSAFLKASAHALQGHPVVNAVIDGQEIVYRDYVDISVAVATPKGLVVPVLRGVEAMNYTDIERGLVELGEKARSGSLAVEDMDGGTFTVSNGGVFGSLYGTPIINPPQSAILGMHGIFDRPVAVKGKVEIRPMMYVALTYDHRLIDGREAVTFLRSVKSAVEDPRVILLDL